MKPADFLLALGGLVLSAVPGTALAADPHAGHSVRPPAAGGTSVAEMSEGTVRKIDTANGRVTIAHGPLANLGMPPMTMVFKVKDAAFLRDLKVGDGIRFVAEQSGNDYVVSRLQRKP